MIIGLEDRARAALGYTFIFIAPIQLVNDFESTRGCILILVHTYNILIDGFCKYGKREAARDLFNDLSSKGLLLDVWMYNIMIFGLCEMA
ncbi:unnamed protein product [Thlaspi arvense]|uniref:Pentatricopeptide repeat-containing protein n=1 Tax=Thlaspi arvense TaxID=13288 RepID=A0AAU9RGN8_THLAR|nr:unnamed protein product [Thlaspi arvense]